jgi:DNA polymerase-3 subunit delta
MAAPTLPAILKDIKARKFASVYLLHGEEAYFIEQIADAIESKALTESEKVFNQVVCYGKDSDARTVIDNCRQYPMMAQHRLVIVKEAQMMPSDQFLGLEPYIAKSAPTTILVICYMYKKADGRTNLMKTAKSKAVVFESKKLYSNQIPQWIESYCKEQGLSPDGDAIEVLYEYIGNDLPRLANEIQKLKIGLQGQPKITSGAVYDNIGVSREYNLFELQKAIGLKDLLSVEVIVQNLTSNMKSNPMVMITGIFFSYFSKLLIVRSIPGASDQEVAQALGQHSTFYVREYKAAAARYPVSALERIIDIIRTYDLKTKGIGNRNKEDSALLREMVQRILYAQ